MNKAPRELNWKELKYFSKAQIKDTGSDTNLIGQERAREAINFGLHMKETGYNVYIAGYNGTGRTTFATTFAKEIAAKEATPPDLCYVYNFENPKQPKLLRIPAGTGKRLKKDMSELLLHLNTEIPKTFSNRDYEQKKNSIVKILKTKHE